MPRRLLLLRRDVTVNASTSEVPPRRIWVMIRDLHTCRACYTKRRPLVAVAARRPAAGSNCRSGQTHKRGKQGRRARAPTRRTEYRRQGRERPLGVDDSKLIRLDCSMWPVGCALSPTPGNKTPRASCQQGADRGVMRPAGGHAAAHSGWPSPTSALLYV